MAVKKKSPRKSLKALSWTYMILAVLTLILGIVIALIPDVKDVMSKYIKGDNPLLYFETVLIVDALVDVWYFWLARRFADGKSNGTLLTILLALSLFGECYNMFAGPTKGGATFTLILDAVALYFVTKIKGEDK